MSRHLDHLHPELRPFVSTFGPAVGATAAMPVSQRHLYEPVFTAQGIRPRDASRNTELGVTISQPDPDTFIVGRSWLDGRDGRVDEDHFRVDLGANTFEKLPNARLEREDPRYARTHHGDKGYLVQSGTSST